jgi:T5SS/PEP-CTERM-associated repeat protein
MNGKTLIVAAMAGLPLGVSADAAVLVWNLAGNGNAGLAGTWNPAQVPVAGDNLNYNLGGLHSVSFTAANPVVSVAQHNFNAGVYSLANAMGVPHTSTMQFVVGLNAGSTASVALTQGAWNVAGTLALGGNATSTGTLDVLSGSMNIVGVANIARIGNVGTGILNVESGADFIADGAISIGKLAGSNGTATITGVSVIAGPSELKTLDASAGDLFVGELGPGTLNVTEGGQVTVADDMFIAPNAGVIATATFSSTTTDDSDASVAGDLFIAANTTAAAGGTGELVINNSGQVDVGGAVRVGDAHGGFGTLRIHDAAGNGSPSLVCQSLIFDTTGHGGIDFRDGLIEIRGGTFVPPGASFSLNGIGGATRPTMMVGPGATSTMGTLSVGTTNNALMLVVGGSTVSTGAITLAQSVSSTLGWLDVSGGTLNFPGQSITVGNQGDGRFDVEDDGDASGGSMLIANLVTSVSTVTVDGAGSTLSLTGDITMSSLGSTGTPTLRVLNSGVVNVGGAIHANSDHSLIEVNGGTINATDIALHGVAMLRGQGRVNANLRVSGEFDADIVLTGPLDLGRDFQIGSVTHTGQTDVGAHSLTIRGTATTSSRLGEVVIAGGSINAVTTRYVLANGDSLTGFGTINTDFEVAGSTPVVATGTTGLVFAGDVAHVITAFPMNFSGTKFTFSPTCNFAGKGAITGEVNAQPGSVITATGDLAMGSNTAFGVVLGGATMHVGAHHVTLTDSNGLSVGNSDLAGGTLELLGTSSTRVLNTSGGSLSGHGTLIAPRFRNISGGSISPGASGASGVGTLTFSGTYDSGDASNPAGTLNIDLGGPLPAQLDRLVSAGNATLDGTLNVSLVSGYVPQPGVFHDIISSTGGFVLGEFSIRNMPPGFVRVFLNGSYSIGLPCIADVDDGEGGGRSDGGVTIDDLLYYLALFEAGDIEADVDDGSGTGTLDGGVTIDDLIFFLEHFELGC